MSIYLTSYPFSEDGKHLSEKNGFRSSFLSSLEGKDVEMLFVASDPSGHKETLFFASETKTILENEGLSVSSMEVLDNGNKGKAASLFKKSNLVVLSGGHVPTQNAFFSSFPIKMLLSRFKGTVLGISAGTMNSGKLVYLMPEEEGETKDKALNRVVPGLGLSSLITIPHYREDESDTLDGVNLWREVVYPLFRERMVLAIPDGTYIHIKDGEETIHGKSWGIIGNKRSVVSEDGEVVHVERE